MALCRLTSHPRPSSHKRAGGSNPKGRVNATRTSHKPPEHTALRTGCSSRHGCACGAPLDKRAEQVAMATTSPRDKMLHPFCAQPMPTKMSVSPPMAQHARQHSYSKQTALAPPLPIEPQENHTHTHIRNLCRRAGGLAAMAKHSDAMTSTKQVGGARGAMKSGAIICRRWPLSGAEALRENPSRRIVCQRMATSEVRRLTTSVAT